MGEFLQFFRRHRTTLITLTVFILLLLLAFRSMGVEDWVITMLRGLSVGSIIFLVAAGFSLIFGLMDVLNLAHGTFFMIGAYVGWTIVVRPDTAVDALTPLLLLLSGFFLLPVWGWALERLRLPRRAVRIWPWVGLLLGAVILALSLTRYPITTWDVGSYEISPTNYAFAASQGHLVAPEPKAFSGVNPAVGMGAIVLGAIIAAGSLAGLAHRGKITAEGETISSGNKLPRLPIVFSLLSLAIAVLFFLINTPLSEFLLGLDNAWLFVVAVIGSTVFVGGIGALMEYGLIRPLYATPINSLLMTLGVSLIGTEIVRRIWGNPEFTMPRPSIFNAQGEACPAVSLVDWFSSHCATITVMGGRLRVYNEIFIPLVGLTVLIVVWVLLQRTRLGMTIRAGVQDSEMVEALGINVRRVFTMVFALGVGLAALGGVIAAPSMGLSTTMGDVLLLDALIALAIGGLTSYPGAAAGALIVGLLQQFIIKYGSIGIPLPFLDEPFKPTPPLVPASTVLLMVIILLILPQGLFGREE
jgi:branched-chain amino acid transport system permease protein